MFIEIIFVILFPSNITVKCDFYIVIEYDFLIIKAIIDRLGDDHLPKGHEKFFFRGELILLEGNRLRSNYSTRESFKRIREEPSILEWTRWRAS